MVCTAISGNYLHKISRNYLNIGHYIWGRGTCDCKGTLISALYEPVTRAGVGWTHAVTSTALETLLSKDFKPTRSVFVVSGFDEETSGNQVREANENLVILRIKIETIGRKIYRRLSLAEIWRRPLRHYHR
jgi:hypothetical protein